MKRLALGFTGLLISAAGRQQNRRVEVLISNPPAALR
jgi:hypothetical protein